MKLEADFGRQLLSGFRRHHQRPASANSNELDLHQRRDNRNAALPAGFHSVQPFFGAAKCPATWSSPATASPRPNTTTTTTPAWTSKARSSWCCATSRRSSTRRASSKARVYTAHAQIFSKATNAKMHGAKACCWSTTSAAHPGDADELEKFGGTAGPDQRRHPVRAGEGRRGRTSGSQPPARALKPSRAASTRTCSRNRSLFPPRCAWIWTSISGAR